MRNGWLVTVTNRRDHTESAVEAYVVAEPDPRRAMDLLFNAPTLRAGQRLVGLFAVQARMMMALGVPAGAVAPFR